MLDRNGNVEVHKNKSTGLVNIPRAPETFHFHKHYRDTVSVQRRRNKVNDDEIHEKNGNLEDILIPHHEFRVEEMVEKSGSAALDTNTTSPALKSSSPASALA